MQETLLAMNSARSCAAMYEALRGWVVPTQNVVYADVEGNIAHTHAGRIPVRAGEPALVPVPGWTGEHEWIGYIPFEELPHQHNPAKWLHRHRQQRRRRRLLPLLRQQRFLDWRPGATDRNLAELVPYKVDLITMQQMQYDTVSQTALEVAARLAVLPTTDPFIGSLLAEMTLWDGDLRQDSRPAAIYEVFMHQLARLVLAPKLGDLLDRAMGQGPTPVLAADTLFSARVREWLENLLAKPDSVWFDLGNGEKRDDCMRLALAATVDYLRQELGEDPAGWQWGALHKLHFAHALGTQPPLDRIFNRGPYPYPGDATTLHASGGGASDLRSTKRISAPFRFIVDMGHVERAWGQLVPGQSGHPASRHYDDQIKDHLTGFYHPMWFTLADVESNAVDILQLKPRS